MGAGDGDGERGASAHAEGRMRHCHHVQMYTHSNTAPLFVMFLTGSEKLR